MIRTGFWLGESGAGLVLKKLNPSGILEGQYRTAVGNARLMHWYPASGMADTTVIGFSVLWHQDEQHLKSLTSWTGRLLAAGQKEGLGDPNRERLELLWNLQRLGKDSAAPKPVAMWESNLSGYSILYHSKTDPHI